MFGKRSILIVLIALTATLQSSVYAGRRAGIYLAPSIGLGLTGVFSEDVSGKQQMAGFGPALAYEMGYAPIDRLQLHIGFSFSMFRAERFMNVFVPETLPLLPILGPHTVAQSSHIMYQLLGATYYLSPTAPSWLFGGAIGVEAYPDPYWEDVADGVGGLVEIGYEFAKHFSVKLMVLFLAAEDNWYNKETKDYELFHSVGLSALLAIEYCLY